MSRRNELSDELSQVHPAVWLLILVVAGAGIGAVWKSTFGPILTNTVEAVKNGHWTQTVGELPQVGEVTAVTVVGVCLAVLVLLFFIGRGIAALRDRARSNDRGEAE